MEYDVEHDKEVIKILNNPNLSKQTKETYKKDIRYFCKIIGKPYHQIIDEIKKQQYDKIDENNRIIRYNPNEGLVNEYLMGYLDYSRGKGNKESTLSIKEKHIRTVFNKSGIILPDIQIKHNNTKKKKNILTKDDIRYVISKSNIHHKSVIAFASCTGLRVADLCKLTIEDYMEATRGQHNCFTVEEFIETAPYDMIGFFEIIPQKTEKMDLECRVCNTPESNNYILDSLVERQDLLKEKGLKLEYDDALFSSRKGGYKKPYKESSLSSILSRKNKILKDYKTKILKNQFNNHEISRKEYNQKLKKLPKFHAHALRHFFITTVRAYTTNRDVSLIMEAHTSPYKMDAPYVGKNEDMFSDEVIIKTYKSIIPYLTFDLKMDAEEYLLLRETRQQYKEQLEKNKELESKYNELSGLVENMLKVEDTSAWRKLE